MPLPVTYTAKEVAASFRISTKYLGELVRDGKVKPLRTSDSPRSPMRFTDDHVEQVRRAMTPTVIPAPQRKKRRRSAA
jgi:hypothetical protein